MIILIKQIGGYTTYDLEVSMEVIRILEQNTFISEFNLDKKQIEDITSYGFIRIFKGEIYGIISGIHIIDCSIYDYNELVKSAIRDYKLKYLLENDY